jgi:ParB family chromosome partitioning protein
LKSSLRGATFLSSNTGASLAGVLEGSARTCPPMFAKLDECREAAVVRREWLRQFLARKTPPKGAETLICAAVVGGHHTLTKAMDDGHPMLRDLLGITTPPGYGGGRVAAERLASQQATTPKTATITTLAAVVAAWEASTGKHTWRNPTASDARIIGALTEWGYQPSEVENLLTAADHSDSDDQDDSGDEPESEHGDPATEASDGDVAV